GSSGTIGPARGGSISSPSCIATASSPCRRRVFWGSRLSPWNASRSMCFWPTPCCRRIGGRGYGSLTQRRCGGPLPTRSDVKWSQLKVGITVAIAVAVLVVVIFATTGQTSWFTPRITIYTFVPDAGGMLPGANVNLEGVVIGNVTAIHLAEHPPEVAKPVEVTMSVAKGHERWLRTNSKVVLGTAGPLGQTLVNISSGTLASPPATNGTVLPGEESTGINELLVSSHDVVTNANALLQRMGALVDQIQAGKGSTGKLLTDDGLYVKLDTALDNFNSLLASVQHGNGTAAKLINDPALYTN